MYLLYSTLFIVLENAGIEPRTVATLALAVRRSNHSAKSHPLLGYLSCDCHFKVDLIPFPGGTNCLLAGMSDGLPHDEVGGLQQLIVREILPLILISYLFLVEPPVFLLAYP